MCHPLKQDLVSVVIPTYNSVESTLEAIGSVRAQTHKNWEILLIDDGSTSQNQKSLLTEIDRLHDDRIRYKNLTFNQGPAIARNLGIENAIGRYIAFLDCDDLWKPEKLSKHLDFIKKSNAVLTFTSYVNVDQQTGRSRLRTPSKEVTYHQLLKSNVIGNSTVIIDTNRIVLPKIPNLRRRQDFAYWLKILKPGLVGRGLQEPLTERRILSASLSSNKIVAAKDTWKMYRISEKMGVFRTAYFFTFYVGNSIVNILK